MGDLAASGSLVLDTSVWINLMATEAAEVIVASLACTCLAPEPVVAELKRDPITGATIMPEIRPLLQMAPSVSIIALDDAELELFLDLVGGRSIDALGDGEAAAIAIAVRRQIGLVIDDRKARRIIRERFDTVAVYWTVDILRSSVVTAALGATQAAVCFDKARRYGRMHIPKA